jgi:regulatory protein
MAPAITEITAQAGKKNRLSVFVDGEPWLTLSQTTAEKLHLSPGEVCDLGLLKEKILVYEKAEGFERLSKFLGLRPRSRQEVRLRLFRFGYHSSVVDILIQDLAESNLIEDYRFAEWWVREGVRAGKGAARLKQELLSRGTSTEVIEAALRSEYREEKDFTRALRLARQKLTSLKRMDPQTARRRLTGLLQRRGFPYQVSVDVWRFLEGRGETPAGR